VHKLANGSHLDSMPAAKANDLAAARNHASELPKFTSPALHQPSGGIGMQGMAAVQERGLLVRSKPHLISKCEWLPVRRYIFNKQSAKQMGIGKNSDKFEGLLYLLRWF